MGCVASKKKAVSVTPAVDSSGILRDRREGSEAILASSRRCEDEVGQRGCDEEEKEEEEAGDRREPPGESDRASSHRTTSSTSSRLRNLHKYIEGEQVAAGWPTWLTAVAGEAIQGWVPLKADSFEKLEKIGQGTYSSVFRARELDTGKIVALKKVRFDTFEPESVRFMAREIQMLRRLDHPNVMKLEGLIASRLSCSMYLVFEYMEHDLAGLLSCPDLKFTESQIKCYMHQLLSGLEHCHSRGIIHRDIKGANLLVNNEGVLKIADFGLANFWNPGNKQPLTSRVVTLWYRPPELLLGSTNYEATVDLWSVGCLFAEMFLRKPVLQGRTEVEQLHKIFKLCGSPTDEYWKKSKLPHATIFKPHHPYESCLRETFKILPGSAISLLETLLSVEPYRRCTASTALSSEYFRTKPYACEPSNLPKCPPTKEIDAKAREDSRRKRMPSSRGHGMETTRKPSRANSNARELSGLSKLANHQEESRINTHGINRNGAKQDLPRVNDDTRLLVDLQPRPAINPSEKSQHIGHNSQENVPFSGPLYVSASSGFAWAKKQREDSAVVQSRSKSSSRSNLSGAIDLSSGMKAKNALDLKEQANRDVYESNAHSKGHEPHELAKRAMLKRWAHLGHADSFGSFDMCHSQEFSGAHHAGDAMPSKNGNFVLDYRDQGDRVDFSGPLLSQSHKVDELLQKHERHIRQAVRKSWFQKVRGRK